MLRSNMMWVLHNAADAVQLPTKRQFARISDIYAAKLARKPTQKQSSSASSPYILSAADAQLLPTLEGGTAAGTCESTASSSTASTKSWLSWLPWRRKLTGWQKFYWGASAAALTFVGYIRYQNRETEEQRLARLEREKQLEDQRKEFLRAVMAGRSFLEGDDPFKGMNPKEIQKFVDDHQGEVTSSSDDPFEGLSPEEIDEYVAKHGINATPSQR